MAYWIAHLRIAELVLEKLAFPSDPGLYYAGCLAPDSGSPVYDSGGKRTGYSPPRRISHWTDDSPDWDAPIRYERFYGLYVKDENDFEKMSFYFGYYIHLLTDALWIELVRRPLKESLGSPAAYEAAKPEIKADWSYTDRLFLQKHPDFEPLRRLCALGSFRNVYLDYFPENAVEARISSLPEVYAGARTIEDRDCPYFSYRQYEQAVYTVSNLIALHCRAR